MIFVFNSRETYLEERAEWKAEYQQLTKDIVKSKHDLKAAASAYSKAPAYNPKNAEDMALRRKAWNDLIAAENNKDKLKRIANQMLEQLAKAKIESCKQWEASRLAA
jgi:hypothetical protein